MPRHPQGHGRGNADRSYGRPVREAKDSGDVVGARLRAVLDGGAAPADGPLEWADIIPAWSAEEDDVSPLGSRSSGGSPGGDAPPAAGSGALPGEGAFEGGRRRWLHAFDPGRPGVRALGAVALTVVLIAAFVAWRARPRVDPVEPSPVVAEAGPSALPRPAASSGEVVVAVGGKVRRPGLVRLSPGARVADALTAAGGADPGVDVAMLNLARRVADGELIMVGVTPPPGAVPAAGPSAPAGPGSLVNLNAATLADLDGLPGVGPVLAQRILDARETQGGFRAVSDLRKVDGIGQARFEQLKDLVTV
ncbi:ComEA family DNA-binding protein [Actinoplanes hulinensis]|uniref:ComEA family DNA-binding protein n=1 Tax=Actinoplanes hulinensis TaxID=1144547 RepID=A0ABS7B775_9ACTN|nr:ComEA family DNA-binding protein [Actinoplanes hulinensis]